MHEYIVIVEKLERYVDEPQYSFYRTECDTEVEACVPALREYSSGLGEQTQIAPGVWYRCNEDIVAVTIIQVSALLLKNWL